MHSWVILPNHVHLLLTPHVSLSKLLGSLKAASAKRANLLLRRTRQCFWQDQSYDHLVRSEEEFQRIQRYIENNPVAAGLAARPGVRVVQRRAACEAAAGRGPARHN